MLQCLPVKPLSMGPKIHSRLCMIVLDNNLIKDQNSLLFMNQLLTMQIYAYISSIILTRHKPTHAVPTFCRNFKTHNLSVNGFIFPRRLYLIGQTILKIWR